MPARFANFDKRVRTAIILAARWLESVVIDDPPSWPVSTAYRKPSVWSGTANAIRAFAAIRDSNLGLADRFNIDFDEVVAWLLAQQNPDGSFYSDDIDCSGVEPTAWVLVAFHDYGLDANAEVAAALAFLTGRVRNGGSVSSPAETDPSPARIYPAALTFWALTLWDHAPETRKRIRNFLLSARDPNTEAWGPRRDAPPNPAITGLVLYVLLTAGDSPKEHRSAIHYLLGLQRSNGSWTPAVDEWVITKEGGRQHTHDYISGSVWGLRALTVLTDRRSKGAARRAAEFVLDVQGIPHSNASSPNAGSWTPTYHIGNDLHPAHTAECVVSLVLWRDSRPTGRLSIARETASNLVKEVAGAVRHRRYGVMTFGIALVALAPYLDSGIATIAGWLSLDPVPFRENFVAGGLLSLSVGMTAWIYRVATRGRHR